MRYSINHKVKINHVRIATVIGAVSVVLIGLGVFRFYRSRDDQKPNSGQNTPQPKTQSAGSAVSQTNDNPQKTPVQYEGADANKAGTLSGVITYHAVTNNMLTIRTVINQTIGSGKCTLTLANNGKSITKTADIIQNPSSATCGGFDVPTTELGGGKWDIVIDLTDSNNRTGKIVGEVTI